MSASSPRSSDGTVPIVTSDAITLVIPRDKPFFGVARLVVGGLAARLDLPLEHLEDLHLALESVLEHEVAAGGDVALEVSVAGDGIGVLVGPLDGARLRDELERESDGNRIGLRRLLTTVVQDVSLVERDGAHWLRLEKRVAT